MSHGPGVVGTHQHRGDGCGKKGEKCRNPMFSVTPLYTRENKVFANFCSDLVGTLCKEF